MLDIIPQIKSIGVDWLTGHSTTRPELLLGRALHYLNQSGETGQPFSMRGYKGLAITGFRYGSLRGNQLVMLSGSFAAANWLNFLPLCETVSRIDLQVTMCFPQANPNLANEMYAECQVLAGENGNFPKLTLISTNGNGDTLYLGSRYSNRFVRVYDKYAESGCKEDWRNCWRFEVQYNDDLALAVANELQDCGNRRAGVYGLVRSYFSKRDITVPFYPLDVDTIVEPRLSLEPTSLSKKLAWLHSSVAPCIAKLRAEGHESLVVRVLGLDQPKVDTATGEVI